MKKQVFKHETLTRTKVKNNILKVWEQTTESERFDWYFVANNFARSLAGPEISVIQVCGVIAALSPLLSWAKNMELANLAVQYYKKGEDLALLPYMKTGLKKAERILSIQGTATDDQILNILKGQKISSFYLNLAYPDKAISLTIDRHAIAVALGRKPSDNEMNLTANQYKFFIECYRHTAAKLDISPLLLQSATWENWRKNNKKRAKK